MVCMATGMAVVTGTKIEATKMANNLDMHATIMIV